MGLAAGLLVAGTAVSAFSSIQQGQYGAQVARYNQQIANQNAKYALQTGAQEEQAQNLKTGQILSAARANAAASGVDPNVGTPVNLQSDTAQFGKLDALTIRNNALRRAWGYKSEAIQEGAKARQDTTAGYLGAASSLLGGAGTLNEKWKSFFPDSTT